MKKDDFRINNPNYDKEVYQNKKELKKQQGIEWRRKNPDKVKELNLYHSQLRYQKLCEKRKKELHYDKFDWLLIPDIERNYYVNREGIIIDEHFKKIKIRKDKIGYLIIALDKKHYLHHRIIAKVYVENPNNKKEVNHKNGIKDDNRIENLEWVTRSENIKHSFEILGKKSNLLGWRKKKEIDNYSK